MKKDRLSIASIFLIALMGIVAITSNAIGIINNQAVWVENTSNQLVYLNTTTNNVCIGGTCNLTSKLTVNGTIWTTDTLYTKTGPVCTSNNGLCTSGGNTSFNQTLTDTLYYAKNTNPLGFYNITTLPAYPVGDNQSWNETYARTIFALTGSGGNTSFNQTLTDTLYYAKNTNPLGFYNSTTIPNYVLWTSMAGAVGDNLTKAYITGAVGANLTLALINNNMGNWTNDKTSYVPWTSMTGAVGANLTLLLIKNNIGNYTANPAGYYNITTLPAYPVGDNQSWNETRVRAIALLNNGTLTNAQWCLWNSNRLDCTVTPITNNNQLTNGAGYITGWGPAVTSISTDNTLLGGPITSTGTLGANQTLLVNYTTGDTRYTRNATIPTCTGTDKLTSAGNGVMTCATDQTGASSGLVNGSDAYFGKLNASTLNVGTTNLTCNQVSGCVNGAITSVPYQSTAAGWTNTTTAISSPNTMNISIDGNTTFFDVTNNRVGILTINGKPTTALEVNGSINVSGDSYIAGSKICTASNGACPTGSSTTLNITWALGFREDLLAAGPAGISFSGANTTARCSTFGVERGFQYVFDNIKIMVDNTNASQGIYLAIYNCTSATTFACSAGSLLLNLSRFSLGSSAFQGNTNTTGNWTLPSGNYVTCTSTNTSSGQSGMVRGTTGSAGTGSTLRLTIGTGGAYPTTASFTSSESDGVPYVYMYRDAGVR